MKHLAASRHFQAQLKKPPLSEQERVLDILKEFLIALQSGNLPAGYGFKKINGDKYEIRIDIRRRIVMKADGDTLVCHLIGNHEEVTRLLKNYRNK